MRIATYKLRCLSFISIVAVAFVSCNNKGVDYVEQTLNLAGDNRPELEAVLDHYRDDPEKLAAAQFLIENMPGHYSYRSDGINQYYAEAMLILQSGLPPAQQRDSLRILSNTKYAYLAYDTIQDVKIIKSDFLIHNIDQAFELWQTKPWLQHLDFDQFCEYVLPYKCYELQSLDYWRDTLQTVFGDALSGWIPNDDTYGSPYNAARAVRGRIAGQVHPFGVQMGKGYSFSAANNMYKLTHGECTDYVRLAICVMRSLGLPVMYNFTPQWGRFRAGHDWYTLLNDKGELLSSEWDISSDIGAVFFPYQRIPKVFRYTYAINRDIQEYLEEAEWQYPFSPFQLDVTAQHFATTDLELPITENKKRISDKYAYLCAFNGNGIDWDVLTFGKLHKDIVSFPQTGRNVLYIVMQYDAHGWFPLTLPFILHSNGSIEYITAQTDEPRQVSIRRKYFSSQNVVEMRRRLLGGSIEAASKADFSDAVTLYTVTNLEYPDRIPLKQTETPYRYWRYKSADGTYGSIAELAFFSDSTRMDGRMISSTTDVAATARAFDGDYLSNFETGNPNGNWVGMDMGSPTVITHARIVPRSDDNDVCPGNEYELVYWDNHEWVSTGIRTATDNSLVYDSIPQGALMWLRNYTRGMDERCFLIDDDGTVEWW